MPEAIKGNIVFEFANAVYSFGVAISQWLLRGVTNVFFFNVKQFLVLVKGNDQINI